MAIRLQYNTQLNVKPRVMKIFTYWEVFMGAMISLAPAFIFSMLGMDPPLLDSLVLFLGYSLIIGYYKVGKPEGYLTHYLAHLVKSEHYRPGKRDIYYPIRPDDLLEVCKAEKRTHKELWDETNALQRQMVAAGLLPIKGNGVGEIMEIKPGGGDEEHDEMQRMLLEYLERGGVIGAGESYQGLVNEQSRLLAK